MNVLALQKAIGDIQPLLNANLGKAHEEMMDSKISKGAYNMCLFRHGSALQLSGLSSNDIDFDKALDAAALFIIDARSMIKDLPLSEQKAAEEKVQAYRDFLIEKGLTATNKLFDIPCKPSVS